jgi:hypothetical protein
MKDILFLLRDLARYSGFAEGHPTGTFAPWKYLDCESVDGWFTDEDLQLLHRGAAVALLVGIVDEWENSGGISEVRARSMAAALETGRFAHLPAAEEAARAALVDEEEMHRRLTRVPQEFVCGTFSDLARGAPPLCNPSA